MDCILFKEWKNMNNNIWLFGCGGACTWLISGFEREETILSGILDDSIPITSHKKINKFLALSPHSDKLTQKIKSESTVVIGILNPSIDIDTIKKRLLNDGWKIVLNFSEWTEQQYIKYKKCFSPISSEGWDNKKEELNQVKDQLYDDVSVNVFESFQKFVITGKDEFPTISKNPYFPDDIPRQKSPLRMLDCGAFTGDTIIQAQELEYSIELVHAFEPDLNNYKILVENVKNIGDVISWPCGVSNKTKILKFANQGNMGSFVTDNGDEIIQCTSIDDCLINCNLNFIKMDIEGSEFDALCGAEKTIKKYLPRLAISLYHLPDDIWKIPLWLKNIYKDGARYYLRNHSRTIADTILYVIPINSI